MTTTPKTHATSYLDPQPFQGESLGEYLNRQYDECGRRFVKVGTYGFRYVDPYGPEGDIEVTVANDRFTVKVGG